MIMKYIKRKLMNKNIIITCNTYYQLIMAVQISKHLKQKDNVTLILTDQSNNASQVYNNIKNTDVFNKVYFIKNRSQNIKQSSLLKFLKDIYCVITGKSNIYDECFDGTIYDELIIFNPDLTTHFLYHRLLTSNPDLIVSRYEEGIISYPVTFPKSPYMKLNIAYKIRKILGRKNLAELVKYFYCVYPSLYNGEEATVKIPEISQSDAQLKACISTIFDIDITKLSYPQKYIYFSSVYDFEGDSPIGELDLIIKISNAVGKDNLLVKVHPRDNIQRFIDAGLMTDSNSSFPWEAIQLNYDFSRHIFLTAASGSVLSVNAVITDKAETYFLYPLCNIEKNSAAKHSAFVISELCSKADLLKNFYIADNIDSIVHNQQQ